MKNMQPHLLFKYLKLEQWVSAFYQLYWESLKTVTLRTGEDAKEVDSLRPQKAVLPGTAVLEAGVTIHRGKIMHALWCWKFNFQNMILGK